MILHKSIESDIHAYYRIKELLYLHIINLLEGERERETEMQCMHAVIINCKFIFDVYSFCNDIVCNLRHRF